LYIRRCRSSKLVTLTLLARWSGRYRISLKVHRAESKTLAPAHEQAGHAPSSPGSGVSDTSGAVVVCQGSHASERSTAQHPLAEVELTATAQFPMLLITDVFCPGMAKRVAWQLLGVPTLNAELVSPVTGAELQVAALEDSGRLTDKSAAELLSACEVCSCGQDAM
jgi:hypothetical protein